LNYAVKFSGHGDNPLFMDTLFSDVLRTRAEPCEYFDDARVHQLLTDRPREYLGFLERELANIAHGRVEMELPPKQLFVDGDSSGDFRVMPCVLKTPQGNRKTVKLVGTNTEQMLIPGQITVGQAFAIHPGENFISHTFAGCLLSSARTGACTAIAAQALARQRTKATIIGTGRVGYYAALYLGALGRVELMHLYDTDVGRAQAAATLLRSLLPGVDLKPVDRYPREGVDLAVLATTSSEPVYGPDDFFAETVISVGADTDWQRELDPRLAREADLFVDTLDSVRYGDLRDWIGAGLLSPDRLTDLLTLIRTPPAKLDRPRRLFISTGSALFDNLTIGYLLSRTSGDTL
jgi:ornithine cyclodeaminase/alanine dehydrogenase-like protein (mu-crystallin family)